MLDGSSLLASSPLRRRARKTGKNDAKGTRIVCQPPPSSVSNEQQYAMPSQLESGRRMSLYRSPLPYANVLSNLEDVM
jgi:hypothetical protein